MVQSESLTNVWLARLRQHLQEERYSRWVARKLLRAARCFLRDLERRGKPLNPCRRPTSSTISMD